MTMNSLQLASQVYNITDENGEVIISAPALDIYYVISFAASELGPGASTKDQCKITAQHLNEEYGCSISWGQALEITEAIFAEVENIKKKQEPLLESLIGLEEV